jgi:hypothetical protein
VRAPGLWAAVPALQGSTHVRCCHGRVSRALAGAGDVGVALTRAEGPRRRAAPARWGRAPARAPRLRARAPSGLSPDLRRSRAPGTEPPRLSPPRHREPPGPRQTGHPRTAQAVEGRTRVPSRAATPGMPRPCSPVGLARAAGGAHPRAPGGLRPRRRGAHPRAVGEAALVCTWQPRPRLGQGRVPGRPRDRRLGARRGPTRRAGSAASSQVRSTPAWRGAQTWRPQARPAGHTSPSGAAPWSSERTAWPSLALAAAPEDAQRGPVASWRGFLDDAWLPGVGWSRLAVARPRGGLGAMLGAWPRGGPGARRNKGLGAAKADACRRLGLCP